MAYWFRAKGNCLRRAGERWADRCGFSPTGEKGVGCPRVIRASWAAKSAYFIEVHGEREMRGLTGGAQSIRTLRTLRKGTSVSSPENFGIVCGPRPRKGIGESKAERDSR